MKESLPLPAKPIGKSGHKRPGKKSAQRNQEKFRMRKNKEVQESFERDLRRSLKLFDDDEFQPVEKSLIAVDLQQSKEAVPLTVATRGVGFATTIFYENLCTYWSIDKIEQVCTLIQFYRTSLWLCYYKAYLAQQSQTEMCEQVFDSIYIEDDKTVVLRTLEQVPSPIALIINNIGKIETKEVIYHQGFPFIEEKDLTSQDRSLYITPNNIRKTLEWLSDEEVALEDRKDFLEHNSIPGLIVDNNLVINANDVYPANYDNAQLRSDVKAFNRFVAKAMTRVPPHSVRRVIWDGKAERSALYSSCRGKHSLSFAPSGPSEPARKTKRKADGSSVASTTTAQLIPSISSERSDAWALDSMDSLAAMVGIASLVGEIPEYPIIHTRDTLSSPYRASINPVDVLSIVITAQRK